MAATVKIAFLADAGKAVREVQHLRETVDTETKRVITGMADTKLDGAFGKWQEGFDVIDTRAMGFRDTVTGVEDSVNAFQAFMGEGEHASDSFAEKLVLAGTGVGDLASGFVNFLIPLAALIPGIKGAAVAMKGLNLAFLTSPIFWIIAAIVLLVAGIVILWKKSETFRKIVTGAFNAVWNAIKAVWNWIKGNWPLLLAIITGPIGLAVYFVRKNFTKIKSFIMGLPAAIRSAFSSAGRWLLSAGRNLVIGLWNGIKSMGAWLKRTLMSWVKATIPGPIARQLGIFSPSRVGRAIGRNFGGSIGMGLDDTGSTVARSSTALASRLVSPVAGASAPARAGGRELVLRAESSDGLMRELLKALQIFIRDNGGDVQAVLGA